MVAVASVNRLVLTPRLFQTANAAARLHCFFNCARNTLLEVAIGVAIIAIVAMLGTNPPGLEAYHPTVHHSH